MKKVIYVEIDEDIPSLYDRIKSLQQNTIYLVVPRKAILFQSPLNLKILKTKLEALGNTFVIVTTDATGEYLAKKLGIETASRVEVQKMEAIKEDLPAHAIPIQARRNPANQESPKRFTEKKITIAEWLKAFRAEDQERKKNPWSELSPLLARPNRKLLGLILLLSLGLFLLIGYVALPRASIYVRPHFEAIDHTVNITLADRRKNQNLLTENPPHVLASEEVVIITKQTKIFNTTTQEFYGENAKGTVTLANATNEEWPLKEGTRLQNETGLVFRLKEGITIPPATLTEAGTLSPATLVVEVAADPFDAYGQPVGDRGNIPPSRFNLPGLPKFIQRNLWAESQEPMTGGISSFRKVVLAEDIEAAKKQIKDNLIATAKEELRSHLQAQNKLNHTQLVLLDDRRYLQTELLDLRLSEDLEGSPRDKFEVFAKIRAQGVAYDQNQLLAVLKRELGSRVHPDRLLREDSTELQNMTYEVLEEDRTKGLIKITATLKGIEEFIVDPLHPAGERLLHKIREKIRGKPLTEAEGLLNNLPELDAASIKISPFWIDSLPRVPENIQLKRMPDAS